MEAAPERARRGGLQVDCAKRQESDTFLPFRLRSELCNLRLHIWKAQMVYFGRRILYHNER